MRRIFMEKERLNNVLDKMADCQVNNLLVTDPSSIDYLINYHTDPGERLLALLIPLEGQPILILNKLFPEYIDPSETIHQIHYSDGEDIISTISKLLHPGLTGIDKIWPSHFLLDLMTTRQDIDYCNGSLIIDQIRSIKTPAEIEKMLDASHRNDQAVGRLIDLLPQALSETEMTEKLATIYQELDCDGFSFEPIVAYGANAADPHHVTDQSKPQPGQCVVLDIGSSRQGYCSDMTRTVFFEEVSDEDRHVYETVLKANLAAIEQVKPGVSFASIDKAARSVIEEAGYGQYFTHRTGHSIGRDVHEYGDVGPFNQDLVQVGNTFSIEPGIYIPGRIGVRIEDLVVVTKDGCKVLNDYPKELKIIKKDR